jgi:hypothetical protein
MLTGKSRSLEDDQQEYHTARQHRLTKNLAYSVVVHILIQSNDRYIGVTSVEVVLALALLQVFYRPVSHANRPLAWYSVICNS